MADLLPAQPITLAGSRLGLLSDSHGDVLMTRRALAVLVANDVDAVVHLGDLCSARVLEELAGLTSQSGSALPAVAVPGNMDDDPEELIRLGRAIEVSVLHPAAWLHFGDRSIVAHHGHVRGVERAAVRAGAPFILHGHTHVARDETVDGVRYINPGALHRARVYTVAILNVDTGDAQFLEIPRHES